MCDYVHLMEEADDEHRPWVLEGSSSRDPDDEPIVGAFEPVAKVSDTLVVEAKRRYAERCGVAEEST